MILSTLSASVLPVLALGPFEPGTTGYRSTVRTGHALAMAQVSAMVRAGRSPAQVAAYVQSLGIVAAGVSMMIEDLAHPGTFAEAVFAILAD